ncbi:MAG: MFS transporter, partial [Myxococcota bacterium]
MTDPATSPSRAERLVMMFTLILAGETIYTLPYFLRRDYATTMASALGVSQTELGTLSSLFGALALISYFPGGWLADRFQARHLMIVSLLVTAAGGFWLSTFPGYTGALAVFALWGVSTILTFWAALIKAARIWGGDDAQGRAFGILDGGRALAGALLGSAALALFSRQGSVVLGFRAVVVLYSAFAAVSAAFVWRFVPLEKKGASLSASEGRFSSVITVLKFPAVWLHAAVIFCAYAGYWGTYNLASYAVDGFQLDAT